MIYEPTSSVRIANREPSPVGNKGFEQVRRYPPEWVGFGSFEARALAAGHWVETHRGLQTVESVEPDVNAPPADMSAFSSVTVTAPPLGN
jgi:predicted sugar kinase